MIIRISLLIHTGLSLGNSAGFPKWASAFSCPHKRSEKSSAGASSALLSSCPAPGVPSEHGRNPHIVREANRVAECAAFLGCDSLGDVHRGAGNPLLDRDANVTDLARTHGSLPASDFPLPKCWGYRDEPPPREQCYLLQCVGGLPEYLPIRPS